MTDLSRYLGLNGVVGFQGSQGAQGLQGTQGTQGNQGNQGELYEQSAQYIGSSDTIVASVVDTAVTSFSNKLVIGANEFTAGRCLHAIFGIQVVHGSSAQSVQYQWRLTDASGAQVVKWNNLVSYGTSLTSSKYTDVYIMGTQAPNASAKLMFAVADNGTIRFNNITQPITVDTTASITVAPCIQWSGNNTGNSATLYCIHATWCAP